MLTFTMGEQEFPIAPEHYLSRVDQQCYSLVVSTDSSEDELGHPFMLAYYSLFDAENYRIGLARSVSNPFPASNWYIWLGIGVIGVVVVAVAVWWLRILSKKKEQPIDLMEPLIRSSED